MLRFSTWQHRIEPVTSLERDPEMAEFMLLAAIIRASLGMRLRHLVLTYGVFRSWRCLVSFFVEFLERRLRSLIRKENAYDFAKAQSYSVHVYLILV